MDARIVGTLVALVVTAAVPDAAGSGAPRPDSKATDPGVRTAHPTATGRLVGYDPVTRSLTLQSVVGRTVYHAAEDTRVWLGTHRLPLDQLSRHLGAQATLAYGEAEGRRVTHTVRLSERGTPGHY